MTKTEIETLKAEIDRLEDLMLEICTTKKTAYIQKNKKKLDNLRRRLRKYAQ